MMLNKDIPIIDNYLTMEALEDGFGAKLSLNACEYCIDESGDWVSLSVDTYTPTINSGQTISFRANLTPGTSGNSSIDEWGIGTFSTTKKFNLKGNCMSMLFGDNAPYKTSLVYYGYAFYELFKDCAVVEVSDDFLPATRLVISCYNSMFEGCSSLKTVPELPATTLAESCYDSMFFGCTSLTKAPELPATTLALWCYHSMFRECTSLTTAPELPATTIDYNCYQYMFYDCTSLETAPELPATTLFTRCYERMFYNCTSLTTAPSILPATTLAYECYTHMFYGCNSLTTAPELPATTLAEQCYRYMFAWCESLNYIKMLATDISANNCLDSWVYNVASSGTFVKNSALISIPEGSDGIPRNWDVEGVDVDEIMEYPYYTINLKNQWRLSTDVTNPDSDTYAGVFESSNNTGVDDSCAKMTITIPSWTLDHFDLYIRSYAESNYDYVMVSQLDQDIDENTDYDDSSLVMAHTCGNPNSGEDISDYTLVSFTDINRYDDHVITIIYRKDGNGADGTDKGYVLIPINQ